MSVETSKTESKEKKGTRNHWREYPRAARQRPKGITHVWWECRKHITCNKQRSQNTFRFWPSLVRACISSPCCYYYISGFPCVCVCVCVCTRAHWSLEVGGRISMQKLTHRLLFCNLLCDMCHITWHTLSLLILTITLRNKCNAYAYFMETGCNGKFLKVTPWICDEARFWTHIHLFSKPRCT